MAEEPNQKKKKSAPEKKGPRLAKGRVKPPVVESPPEEEPLRVRSSRRYGDREAVPPEPQEQKPVRPPDRSPGAWRALAQAEEEALRAKAQAERARRAENQTGRARRAVPQQDQRAVAQAGGRQAEHQTERARRAENQTGRARRAVPQQDRRAVPQPKSRRPSPEGARRAQAEQAQANRQPGAAGVRRSFSQKTLAVKQQGPLGPLLARALEVPPEGGYAMTHGFHPWPGRFHPHLPRTLLAGLETKPKRLLDPFMGGGTALVESLLAGIPAWGSDLNPVALMVARERTRPRTPAQSLAVMEQAAALADEVARLSREKRPPRLELPGVERIRALYAPHIFAELAQWARLIGELRPSAEKETFRAVFSSLAVKFSNKLADSVEETAPVARPKGSASRFFVAKCLELAQAQEELASLLPQPRPTVALYNDDARLLPSIGWGEASLIISSPPYPSTYDYQAHHQLRLDWLGLKSERLAGGEVGARRHGQPQPSPSGGKPLVVEAGPQYRQDMSQVLQTLARVAAPRSQAFLVVGDWLDGTGPVDGAKVFEELGLPLGWRLASQASVLRESHSPAERQAYGAPGKWEHLLAFERIV